jgi:hypothetical protein
MRADARAGETEAYLNLPLPQDIDLLTQVRDLPFQIGRPGLLQCLASEANARDRLSAPVAHPVRYERQPEGWRTPAPHPGRRVGQGVQESRMFSKMAHTPIMQ